MRGGMESKGKKKRDTMEKRTFLSLLQLFDATSPRIVGEALRDMQAACSGETLRRLREDARLSQEDLARRSGLSQPAISKLESGTNTKPEAYTALCLWSALHLGSGTGEMSLSQAKILGCEKE